MRCSSCEPLLDRYVEGTLAPRQMLRIREHLARCAHCAGLLDELRVVDALLATSAPVELAPNFTFAVMAEARSVEIKAAEHRPIWPVLTAYLVTAWIAVAGCFAVFGLHLGAIDALLGSAFAQVRTVLDVVVHGLGTAKPTLLGSMLVVLAIDAVCAAAALYLYRRARSRALRSEAS